ILSGEELCGLDLSRCRLATLSACDTSVGVQRAGLGIASLQSSLRIAGARSTLTSLWKVDDAATAELMASFYRRIIDEGATPAEALRQAKKALRERRAPPRDWAGWVLSGPGD
ncbi:MAG: CHAT domain-containing protein, partial [Planctomycetota bacterium]|nr:CHAT domain-containing protein [Planctomycetota bacterium]